ncbi:MAG: hypothetical protein KME55_33305 [Nostoc indistinguendum CM1-VF10]|nr:hypothetical protein [Nostoc indistinguendum CM1-VF10]
MSLSDLPRIIERLQIFRVTVNRKQSGELEYSPINVGEIESEDIKIWQKAEGVLQQIREKALRQERRQTKGMSLACDGATRHRSSSNLYRICCAVS